MDVLIHAFTCTKQWGQRFNEVQRQLVTFWYCVSTSGLYLQSLAKVFNPLSLSHVLLPHNLELNGIVWEFASFYRTHLQLWRCSLLKSNVSVFSTIHLTSFSVPTAENHSHSVMMPAPCVTVGMVSRCGGFENFSLNWPDHLGPYIWETQNILIYFSHLSNGFFSGPS